MQRRWVQGLRWLALEEVIYDPLLSGIPTIQLLQCHAVRDFQSCLMIHQERCRHERLLCQK